MTMQEEIKKLHDRQEVHEKMFHRHLEIYANNGKELKELKEIIVEIVPMFKENTAQTKQMYEIFNGISTTGKWTSIFAKWTFGLLIGIGSLIIMFHNLFK